MKQHRRLIKVSEKLDQSSSQSNSVPNRGSNLLGAIQNQKLYLKLIGISLTMSKQAGVSSSSLAQIQSKLLSIKGLDEFPMLNQDDDYPIQSHRKNQGVKGRRGYNAIKKFSHPNEQFAFIKEMQRQVENVYAKEQLVLALKKYIEEKKKIVDMTILKPEFQSRKKRFQEKAKTNQKSKLFNRNSIYGKNITELLEKMSGKRDEAYQIMGKIKHLKTTWAHTFAHDPDEEYCPIYNAIFDNSQRLVITAGQDGLIKVWGRENGLLLSNLRGHKGFVNKICISKCNNYLFSAANDGIRFFDMNTMTTLGGMNLNNICDIGEINNEKDPQNFYVLFADQTRVFLLDKKTILAHKDTKLTLDDCLLYNYKHKITAETNVNTFIVTADKNIFLGFTSGHILIFNFYQLEKAETSSQYISTLDQYNDMRAYLYQKNQFVLPVICVVNAHQGEIIQLKWNPLYSCFTTGSKKDGSCRIWEWKQQQNQTPILLKQLKIPRTKIKRKKKTYACNFICWNSTYSHLVCSFMQENYEEDQQYRGDGQVLVYSTKLFEVTWQMSKSIDLSSITCMETHPVYQNIALICDSYGKLLLVDIYENFIINMFEEKGFHLGHPGFNLVPSQAHFSQDGYSFIVATQYGNFSIYGYDVKDFYDINPSEQFFENDYQPFEIHPVSYKPVLNLQYDFDINLLPRGQLCNAKKQSYQYHLNNIPQNQEVLRVRILPKQLKSYIEKIPNIHGNYISTHSAIIEKIQHKNQFLVSGELLVRVSQCLLDHERNIEVYRHTVEQLQNKRLAIMFEQREEKSLKIKQYLQQKVKNLKELDRTLPSSIPMNPENQGSNNKMRTRRGRGRPAQRTAITGRPIRVNDDHSQQEQFADLVPREQDDYDVGSQFNDNEDQQDDQDDEVDQYNNNLQQSQSPYKNKRARSNRYSNRDNRNRRRSQRNANNRKNYGVYEYHQEIEDQDERVIPVSTGIRRLRRPVREQIQELMNIDPQQIRKRYQREQDYLEPVNHRQNINRRPNHFVDHQQQQQNQINIEICQLCLTMGMIYKCYKCESKSYCESCKVYRLKKQSITQITTYTHHSNSNRHICLTCYFKDNTRPQCHENVDHSKYILSSREDTPNQDNGQIMMTNKNHQFLFVPQIDDQVAFISQGYQEFVLQKLEILNNKVLNMQINGIGEQFEILPQDYKDGNVLLQVRKCLVKQIKYLFPLNQNSGGGVFPGQRRMNRGGANNSRNRGSNKNNNNQQILTLLRLETIPKNIETEKPFEFWVFHIPGYDFILKWQIFDDIIKNDRYSKIQLFKMAEMNGQQVQFMEIKPHNPHLYPASIWKNIIVHRGDSKNLRKSKQQNQQMAINIWNLTGFVAEEAFKYQSNFELESNKKYIQQIRNIQNKDPNAWVIFSYFVDTNQFGSYYQFIEVGICLNLILERLMNNFYKSEESFIRDMRHLTDNSIVFNGEDNYITEICQKMVNQIIFGSRFEEIEGRAQQDIQATEKKVINTNKNRDSSNKSNRQNLVVVSSKEQNQNPSSSNSRNNAGIKNQNKTQNIRVSRFKANRRQIQSDEQYGEQSHQQNDVASQFSDGEQRSDRIKGSRRNPNKNNRNRNTSNNMRISNRRIKNRNIREINSESQDHDDSNPKRNNHNNNNKNQNIYNRPVYNTRRTRKNQDRMQEYSDEQSMRIKSRRKDGLEHSNAVSRNNNNSSGRVTRSRTKN